MTTISLDGLTAVEHLELITTLAGYKVSCETKLTKAEKIGGELGEVLRKSAEERLERVSRLLARVRELNK